MNEQKPGPNEEEAGNGGRPERLANEDFLLPAPPARLEEEARDGARPGRERVAPPPTEIALRRPGVNDRAGLNEDGEDPESGDEPDNLLTGEVVERYATSAKFIVGLIGYPGAGKTFFLNRLKYSYSQFEYDDGRSFYIEPGYDELPVGRTTRMTYHEFTRLSNEEKEAKDAAETPSGSDKDFVLFDLPGELFRRLIDSKVRGERAAELSDAIAACDALILVLPSATLFGSRASAEDVLEQQLETAEAELEAQPEEPVAASADDAKPARRSRRRARGSSPEERRAAALSARRVFLEGLINELDTKLDDPEALVEIDRSLTKDRTQLSQFVANIRTMVAKVAALKRLGMKSTYFDALTAEERAAHVKQTAIQTHAPLIYVAISKADALLSTESPVTPLRDELGIVPREELDAYPFQAVAVCEPGIYRGITSTFRWYRFDFLTAFEGQSHDLYGVFGEADTQLIQYNLRNFGVIAIVDWLEFAKRKATALKLRRGKRFWAAVGGSMPRAELRLARRAEQRVANDAALRPGAKSGLIDGMAMRLLTAAPHRVRNGLYFAAVLVLLLGLFTTGVERAVRARFDGDAGGYALQPQPRYASEIALLRDSNPHFSRGFVTAGVQPWDNVPTEGRMFAVPQTRGFRTDFVQILEDIQHLPPSGRIIPATGQSLIERLNQAQSNMNQEYAAESASDDSGLVRERPFINYHIGYVQLRMEAFSDAAASFATAWRLLEGARAVGNVETGRLLGVKIATRYARGLVLLQSGDAQLNDAVGEFDAAVGLLPGVESPSRILLTPSRTGILFDFDTGGGRTPAKLNTANLLADALAAHIRSFQPARDLVPGSTISLMVDDLSRHKGEIRRDHPLAANYLIAAALLGKPLSQVRIPVEDIVDPEQRAAAQLAVRALGQSSLLGDGADVWSANRRVRTALAAGDAEAVERALAPEGANRGDNAAFLDTLVREAVASERGDLARSQRRPLIDAWSQYMRGTGFYALANDLSPAGGFVLGLLIPILLWLGLARLWRFYQNSSESFRMLSRPCHYEDRQAVSQPQ